MPVPIVKPATALLALSVSLVVPHGVDAGDTDLSRNLLERAFRNLYGDDYIQTLSLTSSSPGTRAITRRLQVVRKQSSDEGKALLRFLSAYQVRGTSVLILENEIRSDDLYVYLPATRLTRHLSAAQRGDSFFGTDLAYEDCAPSAAFGPPGGLS